MIHLDTSFLTRTLSANPLESGKVLEWLRAGEILGMSTVAWAEYLCGGESLSDENYSLASQIVIRRVDFTEEMATFSARLFNESGRRRGMLTDCMIAAAAITERASIATANPKDFRKFERFGLTLASIASH